MQSILPISDAISQLERKANVPHLQLNKVRARANLEKIGSKPEMKDSLFFCATEMQWCKTATVRCHGKPLLLRLLAMPFAFCARESIRKAVVLR